MHKTRIFFCSIMPIPVIDRARELYPGYNIWKDSILRGQFRLFAQSTNTDSVENSIETTPQLQFFINEDNQSEIVSDKLTVDRTGKHSIHGTASKLLLECTGSEVSINVSSKTILELTSSLSYVDTTNFQVRNGSGSTIVSTSGETTRLSSHATFDSGKTICFAAYATPPISSYSKTTSPQLNVNMGYLEESLAPHTFIISNDSSPYVNSAAMNGVNERKIGMNVHGVSAMEVKRNLVKITIPFGLKIGRWRMMRCR